MRTVVIALTVGPLLMMSGADAAATKRTAAKKTALVQKSALPAKATLRGMVVVIDPGHGGTDRGSAGYFGNGSRVLVAEDEYMYDVARRLAKECRRLGAVVVETTRDPKQTYPINLPANRVIPPDKREVYTASTRQVLAGNRGLAPRVQLANRTLWRHRNKRMVFVSIHFDATPKRALQGVSFVAPPGPRPKLVDFLYDEFGRAHRLRSLEGRLYFPIVQSGGADGHGERNLYILSPGTNAVRQRVLVELGNFKNPKDVWRIRDPKVRQAYAEIIARALVRVNTFVPLAQCRQDPQYRPLKAADKPIRTSKHRVG